MWFKKFAFLKGPLEDDTSSLIIYILAYDVYKRVWYIMGAHEHLENE